LVELDARQVIELLGLVPLLPEGGHVGETYRDANASAIYYLMEHPDFSGLHRLGHLEIWAHHTGAPVKMLLIDPDGAVSEPVLGSDLAAGQRPQVVVPAGWWQAAEPMGPWSLVSTFMAPPYSDAIVTFATRADMAGHHTANPHHAERIERLIR
jgi:predicted cupin superfamily sugar epimerase